MLKSNFTAELSFVTLNMHLFNGPNDKNLVNPRKNVLLLFNPYPNTPLWDRPNFKETADDN